MPHTSRWLAAPLALGLLLGQAPGDDPNRPPEAAYDLTGGYRFAHFDKDGGVRALAIIAERLPKRHHVSVTDLATGKVLAGLVVYDHLIQNASFSPDGTRVVTAGEDDTACVWDAATGKVLAGPLKHESTGVFSAVAHAAFSPDGTRIVTAAFDRTAAVWDAATGRMLAGPMKHKNLVEHASFSPDGKRVVTASWDKTAVVWDAATGKVVAEPFQHDSEVFYAAFSPDGKRIVTQCYQTATLWDVATGARLGSATVN